jgi:hypothetical protein
MQLRIFKLGLLHFCNSQPDPDLDLMAEVDTKSAEASALKSFVAL